MQTRVTKTVCLPQKGTERHNYITIHTYSVSVYISYIVLMISDQLPI